MPRQGADGICVISGNDSFRSPPAPTVRPHCDGLALDGKQDGAPADVPDSDEEPALGATGFEQTFTGCGDTVA